jgi:hypothetical protein
LAGIEALFRRRGIKRACLQPKNLALAMARTKGGILVKVPPVGLHAMVVAEM